MARKGRAATRRELVGSAMARLQAGSEADIPVTLPPAEADALYRHVLAEKHRHPRSHPVKGKG